MVDYPQPLRDQLPNINDNFEDDGDPLNRRGFRSNRKARDTDLKLEQVTNTYKLPNNKTIEVREIMHTVQHPHTMKR